MKEYTKPFFDSSLIELDDAILTSVGVVEEVYVDDNPFKIFD